MADIQTGVPVKSGKLNKTFKTLLIIGAVLTAALVLLGIIDRLSGRAEQRSATNTYGVNNEGGKAFYLSAERYLDEAAGIKTERWTEAARFLPRDAAIICLNPDGKIYSSSESQELREYVNDGGLLFLVTDYTVGAMDIAEDTGEMAEYRGIRLEKFTVGAGEIWVFETMGEPALNNLGMKQDKSAARDLLLFIEDKCVEKRYAKLLFDEYYTNLAKDPTADILGYGLVMGAIELFIAAVFYFISTGQRFGAPERVIATEERSETEHIAALAKMYRRTGSESIGFRIRMEALLDDAAVFLGMRAPYAYDEVIDAVNASAAFRGSGFDELIKVYKNIDDIRLTAGKLDKYIGQMDRIRRERLL